MTEEQWEKETDPQAMLTHLRITRVGSDRQFRLFACACCRLIWDFPRDEGPRHAVEVAERYADGSATPREMIDAYCDTVRCLRPGGRRIPRNPPPYEVLDSALIAFHRTTSTGLAYYGADWEFEGHDPYRCASDAATRISQVAGWAAGSEAAVGRTQADLLRCIFGNPFRRSPIGPALALRKDGLVVRHAEAAYNNRQFPLASLWTDRLAVLADALGDAGCDDADILSHLRGPGPHVRGCWAVDLLLGKS
jgi:hypothetical protein